MSAFPIGLCSVTFRHLAADQVVDEVRRAGLSAIEWGSDVHAPARDHTRLRALRESTESAGLRTASYGSYFEAGTSPDGDMADLVAAAVALGAPRIRVWPGVHSSSATGSAERAHITAALARAADVAATHGLELALEYHQDTLTDTTESTLRLLDQIGRANVSTYWQVPTGASDEDAMASLRPLVQHLSAVHVFAWTAEGQRLPLATRADLWSAVFALLRDQRPGIDALLEFVPGDDPETLPDEAAVLREVTR